MLRDTISEFSLITERANLLGNRVKIEHINFSFYFSSKYGMQHSIRAQVAWNPSRFKGCGDGYFELHGDYKYIQESQNFISEKEILKAKKFFKEYKVLFAAVWEDVLDPAYVQEYFRGFISFSELLQFFDIDLSPYQIDSLSNLEYVVRKNSLFNMND
jgi:hypothetical protein